MGIPGAPMYSASKHAILGLMRALRMEFETTGLHISTVCPWFAGSSTTATLTVTQETDTISFQILLSSRQGSNCSCQEYHLYLYPRLRQL